MSDDYRVCSHCVMDTTDPLIAFDQDGRCNHCIAMESAKGKSWFMDEAGETQLDDMRRKLLAQRTSGSEFDCVLGLSGGIDSSYVALKMHEWGVNPLVVHVDAGWNSELAVGNVERILEYCDWELHTQVINWESMRKLQLAFLRSGVANQDVPQDHAFFASLYHFATDNGVKYVVSGGNMATEGIFPLAWHHSAMDARNIKAIWTRFGEGELTDFPLIGFTKYYLWYPRVKGMTTLRPLNYMSYVKGSAQKELQTTVGWRPYERKHGESLFTQFFQNYYLPTRFGYDKRRPHLSSMIVSEQVTREQAVQELLKPLYDPGDLRRDMEYVVRKLRISEVEFQELMRVTMHRAEDFPNWNAQWRILKSIQGTLEQTTGRRISAYS